MFGIAIGWTSCTVSPPLRAADACVRVHVCSREHGVCLCCITLRRYGRSPAPKDLEEKDAIANDFGPVPGPVVSMHVTPRCPSPSHNSYGNTHGDS